MIDEQIKNMESAIEKRGWQDGAAAASWYFEQAHTDEHYLKVMKGIDDGDPEILDTMPTPRVGGEWADEPTWDDILNDEVRDMPGYDDEKYSEEFYSLYVQAFAQKVEADIRETCVNHLGGEIILNLEVYDEGEYVVVSQMYPRGETPAVAIRPDGDLSVRYTWQNEKGEARFEWINT